MNQDEILAKCFTRLVFFEMMLLNNLEASCESVQKKLTDSTTQNIIDELKDFLNHNEYAHFMRSKGLVLKRPELMTASEKEMESEIIENHFKEVRNIQEGQFTYDDIAQLINTQINKLLKK